MKIGKQIIFLSLISFVLHSIWENMQAPLFQGYVSFVAHLPACTLGTVGDVVITVVIYFMVAVLKNDCNWIVKLRTRDMYILAVVGFCIAIGIEWRALLLGRWAYGDLMPILPYVRVGLAPVIQMTFLLPLSLYLTKRIVARE